VHHNQTGVMDIDDVHCNLRVVGVPTKSAIYIWGYNQSGQTARKGKECYLRIPKSLPPKLFKLRNADSLRWTDIACGREHTAAVASDGSLFTWGESLLLSSIAVGAHLRSK
jgi:alpha-tubulin suppressor-like RCC1 family protein